MALIVVLWLVVLLSIMAAGHSKNVHTDTTLAAKRTDDAREVLTLSYAPFDPGSERFEAIRTTEPMILTTAFDTVEFEYFGAEMDKERPGWKPAWREDAERLPNAIRIRTRTEFGGAGWPDLVYALRSGDTS